VSGRAARSGGARRSSPGAPWRPGVASSLGGRRARAVPEALYRRRLSSRASASVRDGGRHAARLSRQTERSSAATMETRTICGVPVTTAGAGEVLLEVERGVAARVIGQYISITNTESLYHALRLSEHRRYIQQARLSLCDGVGVIVAGWFWGHRIP